MFEHPPAWTEPIANLTAWFDWSAIAALFTAWAVYVAVSQGSKADRALVAREKRQLRLAAKTLGAFTSGLRLLREWVEKGTPVDEAAKNFLNTASVKATLEIFNAVDVHALTSDEGEAAIISARIDLERILAEFAILPTGWPKKTFLQDVDKDLAKLADRRESIDRAARLVGSGWIGRKWDGLRHGRRRETKAG